MLVSPMWALLACVFFSIRKPLMVCLDDDDTQGNIARDRWLIFFVCFLPIALPLHAVHVYGYGVPFRWEMTLILLVLLTHDDARGAQLFFARYFKPRVLQAVAWSKTTFDLSEQTCKRNTNENADNKPTPMSSPARDATDNAE